MKRPRRVPTKAELIARLPRALRPRLQPGVQTDLAIVHVTNFGLFTSGQADADVLWQWVGGILTFARIAQLIGEGEPEMDLQIGLAADVVDRYARTGRVGFSGPDLQLARDGVNQMDELASRVDHPNAKAATYWSDDTVNALESMPPADAAAALTRLRATAPA